MSATYEIPKSLYGKIIGPKGSTINKLQQDHGVKINLPKKFEETNAVKIEGKDVEGCAAAIESLLGITLSNDPIRTAFVDLPDSKWGAIIGSRGSTLKDIQETTGCTVKVPKKDSKTPYVSLTGSEQALTLAKERIEEETGHSCEEVEYEEEVKLGAYSKITDIDIDTKEEIAECLFFPDNDLSDGWNFDRFLAYLNQAKKTMDFAVYNITNDDIITLFHLKVKAGVKCRLITDNDTSLDDSSEVKLLAKMGIEVKYDKTDACMHHKFCIIDGKILTNGSFNWTPSAAKTNQENIVIVNDRNLIAKFQEHFDSMWNSSDFDTVARPTSSH